MIAIDATVISVHANFIDSSMKYGTTGKCKLAACYGVQIAEFEVSFCGICMNLRLFDRPLSHIFHICHAL